MRHARNEDLLLDLVNDHVSPPAARALKVLHTDRQRLSYPRGRVGANLNRSGVAEHQNAVGNTVCALHGSDGPGLRVGHEDRSAESPKIFHAHPGGHLDRMPAAGAAHQ